MTEARLNGWGRTAATTASMAPLGRSAEVVRSGTAVVGRGLGRSYGDAAQCAGGTVIDSTTERGIVAFDETTGVATALAGTSIDELLRELLPRGWFVPVTPGTRFVTVAGAVASDVHGKNHHADGTFGAAVERLDVVLASGEATTLTPDDPRFWATVGGMGLTAVIRTVTFRCRRVGSAWMNVDTDRAADLDECMALLTDADDRAPYSVAWIDCLAAGGRLGRSVVTTGRHADAAEVGSRDPWRFDPRVLVTAPPMPSGVLNRLTVGAFNELWFRKAPVSRRDEIQTVGQFFHPLDGVRAWNRMYGRRGMVQHQCVVPFGEEATLRKILELLSAARTASFLAVLKRFGAANAAPLSFPIPGWTLALDIPVGGNGLGALLDEIDELVAVAGGRLYLAKDSRARPEVVAQMYPRLGEWQEVQRSMDPDGVFRSDLARRLRLVASAER